MAVSKKSWLAYVKEVTSGTPVTPPTLLVPAKSKFSGIPKFVYQTEDRGTRDDNYDRVRTTQDGKGDIKGNWYNDSYARFLYLFMGASTPSQPAVGTDPTVYSHALTLADVPPTATLYKAYDTVTAYQMVYSAVQKIKLSWDAKDKTLEADIAIVSRYPKKVAVPTKPAMTAMKAFPGYAPVIKLDATPTADIAHMEIELDQEIEMWWGSGNATGADFTTLYFGKRSAKMSFDARFDATNFHDDLDAGTDHALDVLFTGQIISHTYAQSLELIFPIFGIDSGEIDTDKTNIHFKGKGTMRPQPATANSLMTATVQNTVADISA